MNAYWHKDCICTINTYEHIGQSVTYQSADTCLSADPGVASSNPPGPTEIDLFTISKAPYYHNDAFHQSLCCLVDIWAMKIWHLRLTEGSDYSAPMWRQANARTRTERQTDRHTCTQTHTHTNAENYAARQPDRQTYTRTSEGTWSWSKLFSKVTSRRQSS